MQLKSRLVFPFAWGIWGAFIMWLCSVTGWNTWSSHSTVSTVLAYLTTILIYGYCAYLFARGKSTAVKLGAIAGAAILGCAVNWLTTAIGFKDWITDGTAWHAALAGFVLFVISAAIAPYIVRRARS